ncbi:MAG: heavy metal translocating P-type ATPase [Bacteroidota bacterium]
MSRNSATTYIVSGVCCATEETVLRKALDAGLGPGRYAFNQVTGELRVASGVPRPEVIRRIRQAGFEGRAREGRPPEKPFLRRHAEGFTAGTAAGLTIAGLVIGGNAAILLYAAAIAIGGWRIGRRAVGALRTRSLDMNVLMSIAVIGAMAIGKWEEGAAVIVLFACSLMLESYSNERSRRALRSLMSLAPDTASVLRQGGEERVPVEHVSTEETVIVRPGDRIPLDGVVIEGSSTVDEAAVTGEAMPVVKMKGSPVYAGTVNSNGALRICVTASAGESTIARIMRLVEKAQERRAPVERLVDRFSRVYTPAVLGIAVAVAVIPPLIPGEDAGMWLYRALVLLVIACPCALVISTPVAIVSAITRAARHGVLIKGGTHVESLSRVAAVALDKTGTLTAGTPRVTDVVPLDNRSGDEIMAIVAALERHSEHPLAAAALLAADAAAVRYDTFAVEGFQAFPGKGVSAVINGTTYHLGNRTLGEETGMLTPVASRRMDELSAEGKTPILLGTEGRPLGIVAFKDGVRTQGRRTMQQLRRMGIGRTVILSGDHDAAARGIAETLGIEEVRAELLPEEKVAAVEELKREAGTVAMVGDGINDAPALAASSVGIAMGVAGTDAAMETADVVLMSDNLAHLPYVFGLSRSTMNIVRQNIALAVGVKLVFLALALAGVATLWMAVLADDGAALAVILNAMRILRYNPEPS